MADIAIELDLWTRPETQNEREIVAFMADIWFQKDIFAKLNLRKTKHSTATSVPTSETPHNKQTTNPQTF